MMRDYKDSRVDESDSSFLAAIFWSLLIFIFMAVIYNFVDSDAPQQYECGPVMEMSMPIQEVTRI